jgi:hypothetical protein
MRRRARATTIRRTVFIPFPSSPTEFIPFYGISSGFLTRECLEQNGK